LKITRFEEVSAWQEARELNISVYALSKSGQFSKDFSLQNQIRRASISVMANIAEGFDRKSDKEFIQFLYIALASVSEVQSHLYAALDLKYISDNLFQGVYDRTVSVKKLIKGFITYLRCNQK